MKRLLLCALFFPALLAAQDFPFVQETNTIPVTMNHWAPFVPWTLGASKSCPSFGDINNDGISDLLVGSLYHQLFLYSNIGTVGQPQFVWGDQNYLPIDTLYLGVAADFCDLNGDGIEDLFVTDITGNVRYFENHSTGSNINLIFVTDSLAGLNIIAPVLFIDIDNDGDYDMFGGHGDGRIRYFQNIGTPTQYNFQFVTNYYASIDVGYDSNPTFCDIDNDADYDLFVGNQYGNIRYYQNIGTPENASYTLVSSNYYGIDVGYEAAPEFFDIDNDADYDLFVGREPVPGNMTNGDVYFYENIGTSALANFQMVTTNYLTMDIGTWPTTQLVDVNGDNKLDLMISTGDNIRYFQNNGTSQNPSFTLTSNQFCNIGLNDIKPFFCDINADGKIDMFAGTSATPGPPTLHFYLNIGTPQNPNLVLHSTNIAPNNYSIIIVPSLADIDADGDLDLFVSDDIGSFFFYRNTGTARRPRFQFETQNWQGINETAHFFARFVDIDADGDLDLFFNHYGPFLVFDNVSYYENVGTPQQAQMVLRTTSYVPVYMDQPCVWFCDIDSDNLLDLFVSGRDGGTLFYHGTDTQVASNKVQTFISLMTGPQFTIGPNPANPVTAISFQLSAISSVNLSVYDVAGRMVAELANGWKLPGAYRVVWDATPNASGVYLIRLRTPEAVQSEKVVILK